MTANKGNDLEIGSWEYHLTTELILAGIPKIRRLYKDLPLLRMSASHCLDAKLSGQFVDEKLIELSDWVQYAKEIFDRDFNLAWGSPGINGFREDIEASCEKLLRAIKSLYEWETSIASVIPHSAWAKVFDRLRTSSLHFVDSIELFFMNFQTLISDPKASGQKKLVFTFDVPKRLKGVNRAIRKAQRASLPKADWSSVAIHAVKIFLK